MSRRPKVDLTRAPATLPVVTVLPEIAVVLEDIQSVVAVEAKRMRAAQGRGEALSTDQAKSLGTLTEALVKAEKAKRELESEGVSELTDEELEQQLLSELEKLRSKRGKARE